MTGVALMLLPEIGGMFTKENLFRGVLRARNFLIGDPSKPRDAQLKKVMLFVEDNGAYGLRELYDRRVLGEDVTDLVHRRLTFGDPDTVIYDVDFDTVWNTLTRDGPEYLGTTGRIEVTYANEWGAERGLVFRRPDQFNLPLFYTRPKITYGVMHSELSVFKELPVVKQEPTTDSEVVEPPQLRRVLVSNNEVTTATRKWVHDRAMATPARFDLVLRDLCVHDYNTDECRNGDMIKIMKYAGKALMEFKVTFVDLTSVTHLVRVSWPTVIDLSNDSEEEESDNESESDSE